MATAFSQPTQYTPYVENWDKDLALKSLSYKQGKYDLNRQKIKSSIQSAMSIDLIKDEDADYLFGKLQDTMDVVNQYGAGDLSLDSRTDYLQGHIASVADDVVMNGYLGTMKIRNIQKEAEASRKDGTYSDLNFAYSMKDAQKWMNDGQTGSEYNGNSRFVPYSDNNKKILEVIKQIEPDAYAVQTANGAYEYRTREGVVLSQADIKGAIGLLIDSDPTMSKQMEVNAWGQFRGMDDATFFASNASTISAITQSTEDDIKELTQSYNKITDVNDPRKLELQKLIEQKKSQVTNLTTDRNTLENFIYKNTVINDYAEVFAYNKVTKDERTANDAFFKLADYNLKLADYDLKLRQLEIDEAAAGIAAKKEIVEAFAAGDKSKAIGLLGVLDGVINDPNFTYESLAVDEASKKLVVGNVNVEDINPQITWKQQVDKLATTKTEIDNDLIKVLNSLVADNAKNPNEAIKFTLDTYMNAPFLKNYQKNGDALSALKSMQKGLNTASVIDLLRNKEGYSDIIKKYELYNLDVKQLTEFEKGLTNDISSMANTWLDTDYSDFELKKVSIGDFTILEVEGKYYTVDKEWSRNSVPLPGSRTGQEISKDAIPTLVAKQALKTGETVDFGGVGSIKVNDKQQFVSDYLKSSENVSIRVPVKLTLEAGNPDAGIGTKEIISELANFVVSNENEYNSLFGSTFSGGQIPTVIKLMTSGSNLDKLIENTVKGTKDAVTLKENISVTFDNENGIANLVYGGFTLPVPMNRLTGAPATKLMYSKLEEEFEYKRVVKAKEVSLLSEFKNGSVGSVEKPIAPPFTLILDEIPIKTSLNVLAVRGGGKDDYGFEPTIQFQLKGQEPVYLNAKEIQSILPKNISDAMLNSPNYDIAYSILSNYFGRGDNYSVQNLRIAFTKAANKTN